MRIEYEGIQIFFLNHGLRNVISDTNAMRFGVQSLTKQDFRKGTVSDNLCDIFGKLTDEIEEMSSDTYQEEEGTNKEYEEHDDDDKFYDSLDLKMSMKFKFHSDSVINIVPLENSKTFVLINETVYDCNAIKRGLNPQTILSNVLQITLLPSCGGVLVLMTNGKCIKRISNGKLVTTCARTMKVCECYFGEGPAGKQAYACVVHDLDKRNSRSEKMSLLDEFGRILLSLCLPKYILSTLIFFRTYKKTQCNVTLSKTTKLKQS